MIKIDEGKIDEKERSENYIPFSVFSFFSGISSEAVSSIASAKSYTNFHIKPRRNALNFSLDNAGFFVE